MPAPQDKPIESIRLSDDQKRRLVKQVNDHYHKPVPVERRAMRVAYHEHSAVIDVTHPNGMTARHLVLPRNLSSGGMSFMVGRFLYSGCAAQVVLPERVSRRAVTIPARTVRCHHFAGIIHECAVRFDQPVDVERFVSVCAAGARGREPLTMPPAGYAAAEKPDAPRALILEESKGDRRLYRLWMEKLGFRVLEAEALDVARVAVEKYDVELALVMARGAGEGAIEPLRALRRMGFAGPLIALSKAGEGPSLEDTTTAGAAELLCKPFSPADLRRAIERTLAPEPRIVQHKT